VWVVLLRVPGSNQVPITELFWQGDFMGLIQWKKEYEVGIPKIDRQHKGIISILNRILAQEAKGKDAKEIGHILDDLQEYVKEHFRTEEEYMLEHRFSGYEEQRKEHNWFIDRLLDAQKEYFKNRQLISINLCNFVWDWFSQHILRVDKRLSSIS
jgi:hemerythrin-like metal-binding protein